MKNTHILVAAAAAFTPTVGKTTYLPIDKAIGEYLPAPCLMAGYRPIMEEDLSYRQLLPYVTFIRNGEVLAYKRPSAGNESKLHGNWSVGVGGHIDVVDFIFLDEENTMAEKAIRASGATIGLFNTVEPVPTIDLQATVAQSVARELMEELGYELKAEDIKFEGFIVSDENEVSRVHTALHCFVEVDDSVEFVVDVDSIAELTWIAPNLLGTLGNLEAWTRIIGEQLSD
jgi:predicted NUDIX family phosphoesterase